MSKEIRIGLAEDHHGVRQGYVSLLSIEAGLKIVFDVSNGVEVFEKLRRNKIDILLLDIRMSEMDGKSVLKKLRTLYPEVKVIILSAYKEKIDIIDCVRLGAKAYLNKEAEIDEIIDAIYNVHENGTHYNNYVTHILLENIRLKPNAFETQVNEILNPTEIEVLRLLCQGKTNKEIAELLNKSKRTIDGIRINIHQKTNTKQIVELIYFALKNKIHSLN